jgi:ubiquinone/menaquinone biosynthesis C-methylase UbiE
MKADREERYWSRFARSYDADGEYVVGRSILQAINEALSQEQDLGDAVEFGCGTGYFTRVVARNARHVLATDLSDAMLAVARAQLRDLDDVTIQKADCAHTSFAAERFDSVLMINLIHVIDEAPQCLRESQRILRTGGALIAIDLTGFGMRFLDRVKLGFRYVARWGLPPRGGQLNLAPHQLAALVEGAGFRVENIQLLEDGANALYLRAAKA